jgi:peptidoglycan hydrolase CwlO-like protein
MRYAVQFGTVFALCAALQGAQAASAPKIAAPESRLDHLYDAVDFLLTRNEKLENDVQQLRDENDRRKEEIETLHQQINRLEVEVATMPVG